MALHFQVREVGRQSKLTTYIFHPTVPADVHNVTPFAHNPVAASPFSAAAAFISVNGRLNSGLDLQ